MSFAKQLKIAREKKGYTREMLATELNISKSSISNYENAISSPKEDILFRIFKILDVEPNFLFQDEYNSNEISPIYSNDELLLIENYRNLNQEGRDRLFETSIEYNELSKYKKCNFTTTDKKQA